MGAKVASYIPKEEKPKEELMVSEQITINHDGKLYHPLVVAKTPDSSSMDTKVNPNERMRIHANGSFGFNTPPQPKIRKLNS